MPASPLPSAAEQAARVRSGEVSARELVQLALDAVEDRNERLNAFVTLAPERALEEAGAIQPGDPRPLAGVPIAIKDLGPFTAGLRTTFGMCAMGEFVPPADSSVVRRLRAAGAVVIGKTNVPELGITASTESQRFGPARNPWDPARTPGGSSGGSACAVAAGMVALAHGNDGAGSIRIPASCCGLVGLKASRGRVSAAPRPNDALISSADGALVRTVDDAALALDVLAGPETGDPGWAAPPARPFRETTGDEPPRLRVAVTTRAPNDVAVDSDCLSAVSRTADLLQELGHEVDDADPEWFDPGFPEQFVKMWMANVQGGVAYVSSLLQREVRPEELEPLTAQMVEVGATLSALDYVNAVAYIRAFSRQVMAFWEQWDVLVTPSLALPPVEIGALAAKDDEPPLQQLVNAAGFSPFTPIVNVTGQPAISLPLHTGEDGLPIGVQFIGPAEGDALLLSLSRQLEDAWPWAGRAPDLAALTP